MNGGLTKHPALATLPRALRSEVEKASKPFTAPAGTVLFDVGTPCTGFVVLLEGEVEVSRPSANGREILLYSIAPGETCVMTLTALMGDQHYEGRGVARTDISALLLPPSTFQLLIADAPEFRKHTMALLAGRLNQVVGLLEAAVFSPVEQRLARELLAGGETVLTTHQHLADAVGSAREVVSRQLSAWAKAGWVERGRGHIRVLDRAALNGVAEPLGLA